MLCEECKQHEASVLISLVVNGQNTTKHLCSDCMKRLQTNFAKGDIQSLLSSILSTMTTAKEEEAALKCSRCGLSFKEFQETGRLGCAQCYHDFSQQLKPMLLRIHGRSQHSGRVPIEARGERERMDAIAQLRAQMERAIYDENFEDAAVLRDKLKELLQEGEKA